METARNTADSALDDYEARQVALAQRVAHAAQLIAAQEVVPTVARVRAALGGGSPNDLAPALKAWKASAAATAVSQKVPMSPIPVAIAELTQELWARATVAAALAARSGQDAHRTAFDAKETELLRQQVNHLRHELEREAALYGELRAQGARHEAIAKDALARLEASESRERKHLRDLGSARARIAELKAAISHRPVSTVRPPTVRVSARAKLQRRTPKKKKARRVATRARVSKVRRGPRRTSKGLRR